MYVELCVHSTVICTAVACCVCICAANQSRCSDRSQLLFAFVLQAKRNLLWRCSCDGSPVEVQQLVAMLPDKVAGGLLTQPGWGWCATQTALAPPLEWDALHAHISKTAFMAASWRLQHTDAAAWRPCQVCIGKQWQE